MSESPKVAAARIEVERTRAAVTELTSLLADFDAGAVEFIESHMVALQPLFTGDRWSRFVKLAQAFAFQDALELLERAERDRGSPET